MENIFSFVKIFNEIFEKNKIGNLTRKHFLLFFCRFQSFTASSINLIIPTSGVPINIFQKFQVQAQRRFNLQGNSCHVLLKYIFIDLLDVDYKYINTPTRSFTINN